MNKTQLYKCRNKLLTKKLMNKNLTYNEEAHKISVFVVCCILFIIPAYEDIYHAELIKRLTQDQILV